ncbi:MAG: GNAT family N-acetyltransferase [Ginsengibacter sp.]
MKTGEPIPYDLLLLADEELQAIDRYIHQSDIYVVEMGNNIIGVCVLYPIDENTIEIKAIAVDEAYQNQGIGKRMLKDTAVKARKKGCRELIIGTPTTAEKQLAIYQKAGFEWFDVRKDFFISHYSAPIFENGVQLKDMAIMRKQLLL